MRDLLIMNKIELQRKSIFDLVKIGQITRLDASKRLYISYRQTKRAYNRYLKEGDAGLIHKNRGKRSSRSKPEEMKKTILGLYEKKYWDFGPTLASEKLQEEDNLEINAETLRLWLKAAGLWHPRRQRKEHRSRRARRARFGELLQMDGSIHAWFSDNSAKQCLMNLVDDATGKTLAIMDKGETTDAAFRLLKWWIKMHGIPMAIYVDLKSLYISPKSLRYSDDEMVEPEWLTHFSRACKALGIEVIKAHSPQAKGRVERSHGVYQDRFVKELRLRGINTIDEANKLLKGGFIDNLNNKFMKEPTSKDDAHIELMSEQNLDEIMCWEYTRTVSNDWIIRFNNELLQIKKPRSLQIRPQQKIILKKHLNGRITLWSKGNKIPYHFADKTTLEYKKSSKQIDSVIKAKRAVVVNDKIVSPWRRFNPGWLKQTKDHLTATT